jgi:prepilin-type N-terminal cleavage/methylation domain-containing protein
MPKKVKVPEGLRKHRRSQRGFTLIEIMVTVAILSLGILVIYESFFISLDAFSYYVNYLNAQAWINEKIWEFQNQMVEIEFLELGDKRGSFFANDKDFHWSVYVNPVDEEYDVYKLDVSLFWQEGNRERFIYRAAYASKLDPKEPGDEN